MNWNSQIYPRELTALTIECYSFAVRPYNFVCLNVTKTMENFRTACRWVKCFLIENKARQIMEQAMLPF